MLVGAALSSAIVLLAFASHTDAHGNLKEPEATFEDGAPTVEWVTLIENYWDIGTGGDQVGLYKTMAAEKKMTVRDVVLDMVKDKKCGYTRTDVAPQPIPADGKVKWLGNGGGGFTHTGPCEVYIDDTMVLHGDDCEAEYPGGPDGSNKMSEMPVDYSSCNGKCTLSIYWLAFQNAQWQAYVNCVPLEGTGSATQTQPSSAGSATEQQATNAPSTETQSSGGSSAGTQSTDAPAENETQSTEAPSTETQSSGGSSTGTESTDAPAENETQSTEAPSTETQSAEGSSTGAESTDAPAAMEAPSTETQSTPAPEQATPAAETETKCNAPARRLRKKVATL